jgi:hypothetical protein
VLSTISTPSEHYEVNTALDPIDDAALASLAYNVHDRIWNRAVNTGSNKNLVVRFRLGVMDSNLERRTPSLEDFGTVIGALTGLELRFHAAVKDERVARVQLSIRSFSTRADDSYRPKVCGLYGESVRAGTRIRLITSMSRSPSSVRSTVSPRRSVCACARSVAICPTPNGYRLGTLSRPRAGPEKPITEGFSRPLNG